MKKEDFEIVIGLEVHVQLNTNTKIFCGDEVRFGDDPNIHTSTISLAHPGTLPRINHQAIDKGIRIALAIGAEVNKENRFDRKHYFYPDLPKAYQITQDRLPICIGGKLKIYPNQDDGRVIRFHHVHMEEDAGKSIHDIDPKNSMIDLNRAGTPLLEMVTEPDFRSAQEVHDFMSRLQHLVKYIGISDANMEEGSMRCDVNISVRQKGETILNNRCEVKNVNSKKFAKQAVEFESNRQMEMMMRGETVAQETLQFDPESGRTSSIRDKEDAHDYRYFPDPDLPPIYISQSQIDDIKASMPIHPNVRFDQYTKDYGMTANNAETVLEERSTAEYFDAFLLKYNKPKQVSNFLINKVLPYINEKQIDIQAFPISQEHCIEFVSLIDSNTVVHSTAYQTLFPALLQNPTKSPKHLAEELNLIQSNNEDAVTEIVQNILNANPDELQKYRAGKKALLGFFMGQAMRAGKGKVDPKVLQVKLKDMLDQ